MGGALAMRGIRGLSCRFAFLRNALCLCYGFAHETNAHHGHLLHYPLTGRSRGVFHFHRKAKPPDPRREALLMG